jgi:transposase-like protein
MAIFATIGAVVGATVRVKCPHCGRVQVRARERHHYRCHDCHKAFDTDKHGKVRPAPAGKHHGR